MVFNENSVINVASTIKTKTNYNTIIINTDTAIVDCMTSKAAEQ